MAKNETPDFSSIAQEVEDWFNGKFKRDKEIHSAPAWRPEPGETLVGQVLNRRMSLENEYGRYPIITVHDMREDMPLAWHCMHEVSRNQLKEISPKVGDYIAVEYIGRRVTNATADLPPEKQTSYELTYVQKFDPNAIENAPEEDFEF